MKRYLRDIKTKANSMLDWFMNRSNGLGVSVPSMPPIPIREIAVLRGLSINAVNNLISNGVKLAGMLEAERKVISFEAKDILGRQRFSMAHELGHFELHWLPYQVSHTIPMLFPSDKFVDETFTFFRCSLDDMRLKTTLKGKPIGREQSLDQSRRRIRETEANQFAAFLLMPEAMVRDWAKRFKGDLYSLAYQFEVSPAAMEWRLINLKMRLREGQAQAQRRFFLHLSDSAVQPASLESPAEKVDSANSDDHLTILVTPESRLRTLISEIDAIEQISDTISLDLSPFETSELGAIGPTQVLDLALLNDYILTHVIPMRTIATENLNLTLQLPTAASYVSRHLSRFGVFEYLRLGNVHELESSLPREPDTASGSHILIPLTRIEAGVDVEAIARSASEHLLSQAGRSESMKEFADFTELVVGSLTSNVVEHSGMRPGLGKGYMVAQLDPMVRDDQVTGYRVIVAIGDIGIGVRNSLTQTQSMVLGSDIEALRRYLEGSTTSQLKTTMTHDWGGHLQLNSGDTMLGIGLRGTSHLTGLYRTPGLQLTALFSCQL